MKLPRHTASTPPPRETGLVRADPGALTNTGDAQFGAMEGAGRALQDVAEIGFQIQQKKQKISDDTQVDKIGQDITIWADEQEKAFGEMLIEKPEHQTEVLKTHTADFNKMITDKLKNASPGVKRRIESMKARVYPSLYDKVRSISTGKFLQYAAQQGIDVADGYASAGEIDLANQKVEQMYKDSVIGPAKKAVLLDANTENYALGLSRRGEYREAHEVVDASSLDVGVKRTLDGMIDSDEAASLGANKIAYEAAIEAELQAVDEVIILPQDEFLASAPGMLRKINESEILPVKGKNGAGKEGQRKKINDRIKAISEGKVDPIGQFDPIAYNRLQRRITQNSMAVKGTDITNLVGRGEFGGITDAQARDLTALKKFYDGADILGTDLHRIYSGAIVGLRTSKTFSKDKADNVLYAARAMSVLNAWAVKNTNATEADYQAFFDRLMDRSFMDNWSRGWFARKPEEQRIAVRENIESFEEELGLKNIRVISPSGVKGTIPISQLNEALEQGYKEVK